MNTPSIDGMKITVRWLTKQEACSEGIAWFEAQKATTPVAVLHALGADERLAWANWLIVRCMTYKQYVAYAVFAAEQVLDLHEKKYLDDPRPRQAIEAAKACLTNPSKKNKEAARAAEAVKATGAAAGADEAAWWAAMSARSAAKAAEAVKATWAAAGADEAARAARSARSAAREAETAWAAKTAEVAVAAESAEAAWAAARAATLAGEAMAWVAARAATLAGEAVWARSAARSAEAEWAAGSVEAAGEAMQRKILAYGIGLLK